MRQQISATGPDTKPAPYGMAPHPYLVAGSGTVDAWTLDLPAAQVLSVTPDRLLPTGLAAVEHLSKGHFDFQQLRTMDGTEIDLAYSGLAPRETGEVEARLTAAGGTGVLMRWDPKVLPWVQIHTADTADAETNRIVLAVEPLSCPPDAFNFGTDLVILAMGEQHTAHRVIAAIQALAVGTVREVLQRPLVAVGVGEVHEVAPIQYRHLADLNTVGGELVVGGLNVTDHQLHHGRGAGRGVGEAFPNGDRAGGPWRRELHEADAAARALVIVGVEANLVHVKILGPVHIGYGHKYEFQFPVHRSTLPRWTRQEQGLG
ncbi:hypothetical protein ART_1996 [Arthrobacter sp. PAMC 25486]|nr:hypothetical protein ART_1996 [Arthrobacter sp. PAMC 25486]